MKNLKIEQQVIGGVATNVYLAINAATKEAFIIDPADNPNFISGWITSLGITLKGILLTHGHFDHILAVNKLKDLYQVPVYAMEEECEVLTDSRLNLSANWNGRSVTVTCTEPLKDGQELEIAGMHVISYHTPGHTKGGACYYLPKEQVLFSGDSIFCQSIGRTDLPTGSMQELVRSVKRMISILPDETIIYPGHDSATSVADEKRYNPYI